MRESSGEPSVTNICDSDSPECVMIIIIGLVILVAAVIVGVAGVLSNSGSGHALTHPFALFGYHVTGSTGTLFLYGIVVGAIAVAGLSLLLAAARRTSRRGHEARRGLRQSRRETAAVSQDRDDLIDQRDAARDHAVSTVDQRRQPGRRYPRHHVIPCRITGKGRTP